MFLVFIFINYFKLDVFLYINFIYSFHSISFYIPYVPIDCIILILV